MSRIIHTENPGKQRKNLCRSVVLAIRELSGYHSLDVDSRDLAAFISIALLEIFDNVNASVEAWEKRGYWLKADKFRLEWMWCEQRGKAMGQALVGGDWERVVEIAIEVAIKLSDEHIPQRHRIGQPWEGAWKKLENSSTGEVK